MVSVKELESKGLPTIPQIEGLIYLLTVKDEDIKTVMSEVSAKLKEVETELEQKGITCRLFWGPMTWDPVGDPLPKKYPFLYEN